MSEQQSKYMEISVPHPYKQALVAFGATLFFMIGSFFVPSGTFAWLVSGAMLLFYIVLNAAIAIFSVNFFKYFQQSLVAFGALVVGTALLATATSGLSIKDPSHSYRTIYIVLIFGFLTLLALSFLIRSVVDFLNSKDKKERNG